MLRLLIALLLLGATAAPAADRYPVDWDKVADESLGHFTNLLRIDTRNPPGNETKAADYLQEVPEKEGLSPKQFALEPARSNLVVRIKGNDSKRPILVMGHADVVGVQEEKWSVPPFDAVVKDGYIFGRGALDDKDNVTAALMLMLLLKRHNVALDRDVIFLSESGEEGTTHVGIDFMVEKHWDEIEAEYCLAEGGSVTSRDGKVRYVSIATTEKVSRRIRLIARGTAGHGSVPREDNAVSKLATAVSKLAAWQPPMRLNDTTREYFERLATISQPEQATRYNHLADPKQRPQIERYFAQHEP